MYKIEMKDIDISGISTKKKFLWFFPIYVKVQIEYRDKSALEDLKKKISEAVREKVEKDRRYVKNSLAAEEKIKEESEKQFGEVMNRFAAQVVSNVNSVMPGDMNVEVAGNYLSDKILKKYVSEDGDLASLGYKNVKGEDNSEYKEMKKLASFPDKGQIRDRSINSFGSHVMKNTKRNVEYKNDVAVDFCAAYGLENNVGYESPKFTIIGDLFVWSDTNDRKDIMKVVGNARAKEAYEKSIRELVSSLNAELKRYNSGKELSYEIVPRSGSYVTVVIESGMSSEGMTGAQTIANNDVGEDNEKHYVSFSFSCYADAEFQKPAVSSAKRGEIRNEVMKKVLGLDFKEEDVASMTSAQKEEFVKFNREALDNERKVGDKAQIEEDVEEAFSKSFTSMLNYISIPSLKYGVSNPNKFYIDDKIKIDRARVIEAKEMSFTVMISGSVELHEEAPFDEKHLNSSKKTELYNAAVSRLNELMTVITKTQEFRSFLKYMQDDGYICVEKTKTFFEKGISGRDSIDLMSMLEQGSTEFEGKEKKEQIGQGDYVTVGHAQLSVDIKKKVTPQIISKLTKGKTSSISSYGPNNIDGIKSFISPEDKNVREMKYSKRANPTVVYYALSSAAKGDETPTSVLMTYTYVVVSSSITTDIESNVMFKRELMDAAVEAVREIKVDASHNSYDSFNITVSNDGRSFRAFQTRERSTKSEFAEKQKNIVANAEKTVYEGTVGFKIDICYSKRGSTENEAFVREIKKIYSDISSMTRSGKLDISIKEDPSSSYGVRKDTKFILKGFSFNVVQSKSKQKVFAKMTLQCECIEDIVSRVLVNNLKKYDIPMIERAKNYYDDYDVVAKIGEVFSSRGYEYEDDMCSSSEPYDFMVKSIKKK